MVLSSFSFVHGTQTSSANVCGYGFTVFNQFYFLNVYVPGSVGLAVTVANFVAGNYAFGANTANS